MPTENTTGLSLADGRKTDQRNFLPMKKVIVLYYTYSGVERWQNTPLHISTLNLLNLLIAHDMNISRSLIIPPTSAQLCECVCGERENLSLNLNLFLFYNRYKLGRMPLFIWPLIQNYNLSTTEQYSSN